MNTVVRKRNTRVTWDDLEAILLVGQFGSVRRAADSIGVAHTTLAKRVDNAEAALGVVAFFRSTKGYAATDAGKIIIEHAQNMAHEADAVTRSIANTDVSISGTVRISLLPSVLSILIAPHLKEFNDAHPDLTLEFNTCYEITDLDKQQADIVVRFQDSPDEHLYGRNVATQYDAVYASNEFLELLKHNHAPIPLVGWSSKINVMQRAKIHGFSNTLVASITKDLRSQCDLAIAGVGLAILPCFVGDNEPELNRFENSSPIRINDVWVLTQPNLKESKRILCVSRFICDILSKSSGYFSGDY